MTRLTPQPWMQSEASRTVIGVLEREGGEARFVGGCVRDALLGRPVKDIDIACTHTPKQGMALLEKAGIRTFPTGLAHGTITAVCDDPDSLNRFEITTLRKDVACDGRHAEVAFTDDWQEDAARRDFTMNALYASIDGTLFDYFGGVEDARHGRVKFIGDAKQRIGEDALRILRFFRFFAHYGTLPMDEEGIAACAALADSLEQLSGERIQAEMFKLLISDHAADVLAAMEANAVLPPIGLKLAKQALAALDLMPQIEMDAGQKADPVRRLALLLRQNPQPDEHARQVASRWKFSNANAERLKALVTPSLAGMETWHQSALKRTIRRAGGKGFADMAMVAWAEYLVRHADKQRDAREIFAPMVSLAENWPVPEFPLKGRDLKAIGVPEGPRMGQLLAELESYWEEQDYYPNREALLAQADALLNPQDP